MHAGATAAGALLRVRVQLAAEGEAAAACEVWARWQRLAAAGGRGRSWTCRERLGLAGCRVAAAAAAARVGVACSCAWRVLDARGCVVSVPVPAGGTGGVSGRRLRLKSIVKSLYICAHAAMAPADVSSPQLCNISASPYLWEIGVNGPFHTPFPLIKANVCFCGYHTINNFLCMGMGWGWWVVGPLSNSNSAVLSSSQRELSNAPEITFPDAREAKALRTPLGAVG
eukprot:scaffold1177_cov126-Isochrysis_galbana.AAC.8